MTPPSASGSECEACDKALHRSDLDSPWSRGEMYRQEHHALIASLRAERDQAVELMRSQHARVVDFQARELGITLDRCLRGKEKGDCAVEDFLAKYDEARLALSETKKKGEHPIPDPDPTERTP